MSTVPPPYVPPPGPPPMTPPPAPGQPQPAAKRGCGKIACIGRAGRLLPARRCPAGPPPAAGRGPPRAVGGELVRQDRLHRLLGVRRSPRAGRRRGPADA